MKYLILMGLFLSCAQKEMSVEEIAKISYSNLQGQQVLYEEGWLVIPSAKRALEYSYQNSIVSSQEAWKMWAQDLKEDQEKWQQAIKQVPRKSIETFKTINRAGIESSSAIYSGTDKVIRKEMTFAKKKLHKAWDKVLLGSVHLGKLTANDRQEAYQKIFGLKNDIKSDFKSIKNYLSSKEKNKSDEIITSWNDSLDKAAKSWNQEYLKSAQQPNTLMALPYVFWGNLKALWYGGIQPSAEYTTYGGKFIAKKGAKILKKAALVPAGALVLTGRTVWNTGGAIYFVSKSGVRVISNYAEAGLLSSLGLLSAATIAPTYIAGKSMGLVNQIGMKTVGGATALAYSAVSSTYESGYLGINFLYETTKAASKTIVGNVKSGVVLGYHAISSLPAQILLTAINTTWFLVWDGPRLMIYWAKGKIKKKDISSLPVGSVVDIERLKKSGVQLEKAELDDQTVQEVLKALPRDLKGAKK